jgi:N-acetylglucosamine-6-phosphate deacetylase
MKYFQDAGLITPWGCIEHGALLAGDGKIRLLGAMEAVPCPQGAEKIDAGGLLLAPGFIEIQINGGFGHDFTENPLSLWEVASKLPQTGVTSFLPTVITSTPATARQALEVLRQGPPQGWQGAQPLGYHLEGPMLNPARKGAHNAAHIRPPSLEVIEGWSRANGVLLVTLAPELPGALEVVQELRQRGVAVSAGHSAASYEQALLAFDYGVGFGTHLCNAQPPIEARAPGLVGALLDDRRACMGLIPDGIHVHPGMIRLVWKLAGCERLILITDAMAAMGMPPGTYKLGDYEVLVDGTSARLADGMLAGSIITLDQAVRNLCDFTGCLLEEALLSVTEIPARSLGLTGKGRLETGMDADLVLLTPEGQVVKTYGNGEELYSV